MMMAGTLVIWSLSYSTHDTHIPCSDGFSWSAGSGINFQWYGTSEEID